MVKRTYIDTCVIIAAVRCDERLGKRALELLDDPWRVIVVSDAVRLELLPKPRYNKKDEEVRYCEQLFERAENISWDLEALKRAQEVAENYGIEAMDAIHVAHAVVAGVDEFVTAEKPSSPLFRVRELTVVSIRGD